MVSENPEKCGPVKNEKKRGKIIFFTLLAKKDCELLSFQDENFIKMMDSTDKNIAVFLKSLIQHGTF